MQPTNEQAHILDWTESSSANLMLNALAGCGKTSTLEMIEKASRAKPILYLVFNKKNADEADSRMLSTTTIRTFNSLGHRVWAKACAKNLALDTKKSANILRTLIDESPKDLRPAIWDSYWEIIHGVALAKSLGYIPRGKFTQATALCSHSTLASALDETPDDLTADLIDAVLTRSIAAAFAGTIDYNDQLYMPALFGGTFPRFPLVLVDEFQDLSPIQHAMLDKLCHHRVIGVGDPWQNIYAFRGAKQGGMGEAQARFSMTPCDLSVSFRCPRAIVEYARARVPHFKWIKDGGSVTQAPNLNPDDIPESAAIICRNNAPLFRVAMHLLARGRSVQLAGSDIGPKLVGLLRKLGDSTDSQSQAQASIDSWLEERLARESTSATDLAECMKVFVQLTTNLGQAIAYAEHLFAQKGAIRLLTGHKSKGLEFDTVYHLDPWLLGPTEQDLNLHYVISTRSRDRLIEVDSRSIQW